MQVEVVMLPWNGDAGRFDTTALQRVQEERAVEQMDSQLVRVGGTHHLVLVLGVKRPPKRWDADLSDDERAAYDRLRSWRNGRAAAAALPAYRVMTNAMLAGIATRKPTTIEALLEVHGVGPVVADRYGEAVLSELRAHSQEVAVP